MKLNSLDLGAVKADLINRLDREAADARARHVTPNVPYDRKLREAEAYLEAPKKKAGAYIAAEAKETGQTIAEVAEAVVRSDERDAPILARIEALRRAAKIAIQTAPNIVEARRAVRVGWP